MSDNNNLERLCVNIFKNGSGTTTKEELTAKWIEMINLFEREKVYIQIK